MRIHGGLGTIERDSGGEVSHGAGALAVVVSGSALARADTGRPTLPLEAAGRRGRPFLRREGERLNTSGSDLIIARMEPACRMLAEADSASKARQVMGLAQAAEVYAREMKLGEEAQKYAHGVYVDAMRLMGEFLKKAPKNEGGRPAKTGSPGGPVLPAPTLAEVGIGKKESSNAQALAEVQPAEFEKVRNRETSIKAAVTAVRRKKQKDKKKESLKEKAKLAPEGGQAWRIEVGDCVGLMQAEETGCARLVFADPPYNIGVDYGQAEEADRLPEEDYLDWCSGWMGECARLLTPDGSFWVLIGDEYADHFGVLLREMGLHRRQWLIWYESFGVNNSRGFNRCSRHLFWMVKDPDVFVFHESAVKRLSDRQAKYADKRADPDGKTWDSVWGVNPPIPRVPGTSTERIPDFPTQLPLALLRPIVACASDPGDLVIDPFNGSGTTGEACLRLGRRYVGFEKNEAFAKLARLRLRATKGETNERT